MITGKFKGITTVEAAAVANFLGGRTLLYRDAPLLNESQIPAVVDEFKKDKCDCILFDKGANFDSAEYELSSKCAEAVSKAVGNRLKVVLFNVPDNV